MKQKREYEYDKAMLFAQYAFMWCQRKFDPPLKTRKCKLFVKIDRRIKHYTGYYCDREIFVYINRCASYTDVVKTVIHEYTHFLQMPKLGDTYKITYGANEKDYYNCPQEIEAFAAQEKYYSSCWYFVKKKMTGV